MPKPRYKPDFHETFSYDTLYADHHNNRVGNIPITVIFVDAAINSKPFQIVKNTLQRLLNKNVFFDIVLIKLKNNGDGQFYQLLALSLRRTFNFPLYSFYISASGDAIPTMTGMFCIQNTIPAGTHDQYYPELDRVIQTFHVNATLNAAQDIKGREDCDRPTFNRRTIPGARISQMANGRRVYNPPGAGAIRFGEDGDRTVVDEMLADGSLRYSDLCKSGLAQQLDPVGPLNISEAQFEPVDDYGSALSNMKLRHKLGGMRAF